MIDNFRYKTTFLANRKSTFLPASSASRKSGPKSTTKTVGYCVSLVCINITTKLVSKTLVGLSQNNPPTENCSLKYIWTFIGRKHIAIGSEDWFGRICRKYETQLYFKLISYSSTIIQESISGSNPLSLYSGFAAFRVSKLEYQLICKKINYRCLKKFSSLVIHLKMSGLSLSSRI